MRTWLFPVTLAVVFVVAGVLGWSLPGRSGPDADQPASAPAQAGSVADRKSAFIDRLLPAIRAQNRHILEQRERIKSAHRRLKKGRSLADHERSWLFSVAQRHRLKPPEDERPDTDWTKQLLQRVDRVPADLALAQAALESAWGQSRFARQGNNFFGQWCFTEGCGLVPKRRTEGATHEVQVFDSVSDSVETYMRNLNSHPAYSGLREIRAELREAGKPLRGATLAAGLERYSGIGHTYADRLSALIDHNDLERFRVEG